IGKPLGGRDLGCRLANLQVQRPLLLVELHVEGTLPLFPFFLLLALGLFEFFLPLRQVLVVLILKLCDRPHCAADEGKNLRTFKGRIDVELPFLPSFLRVADGRWHLSRLRGVGRRRGWGRRGGRWRWGHCVRRRGISHRGHVETPFSLGAATHADS